MAESAASSASTDSADSSAPTEPERVDRLTGALAIVGGLCLFFAGVPGRLYRGPPGDSYVFDPPLFSGLWVQRVVVPVLAVLALLGVFAAVVGLLRRDRSEGHWHDVAGGLTAFGAAMLLFVGLLLAGTGSLSGGEPDVIGALVVTVAVLGGLLAGLLVIVAGAFWGIGYLRRGRRRLGVTLVVVPLATLLLVVLATFVELPTGGGLLVVLPTVAGLVVLGVDLWREPAEKRERDEETVAQSDDQGA
ncbi:hypothetical protein [Salinirubrum litoreum]|uniref:Uncharacterized protein n=1 Tax=Salinirubrum litoreum TaxID=1126234 RepID=A0ABD5R6R6_9EURY|nr:hypothetical protein [Salinirubrum litoreum]